LKRKLRGQGHIVTVYLRVDDPYSLFLLRRLPDLKSAFDIELQLRIVDDSVPDKFVPARNDLAHYARHDGHLIARLLDETFIDQPLTNLLAKATSAATLLADTRGDTKAVLDIVEAYWKGDEQELTRYIESAIVRECNDGARRAGENATELLARGHYNSAMLHYAGEWYWGLDRLHYLAERLDELGLASPSGAAARHRIDAIFSQLNPPPHDTDAPAGGIALDYFHSFRSPYAYIALERTFALADRLGLTLRIWPVLPMAQRGLPVPRAKQLYIVRDVNREAKRLGIPFGNISDPFAAAERCIALFIEARKLGREREWLLTVGRAVWADGIDITGTDQRRRLARGIGIPDDRIDAAEHSDQALAFAAENRQRLAAAGLWGVPSFVCGDVALWGQDRLGLLVRLVAEKSARGFV